MLGGSGGLAEALAGVEEVDADGVGADGPYAGDLGWLVPAAGEAENLLLPRWQVGQVRFFADRRGGGRQGARLRIAPAGDGPLFRLAVRAVIWATNAALSCSWAADSRMRTTTLGICRSSATSGGEAPSISRSMTATCSG